MTLEQLQEKRTELLNALGIAGQREGQSSIEFGDIQKALATVDREIAKLQRSTSRRTVAAFSNGT